jgi:diadenosine tetraphosphate (Ap4A) HIT family hydrolase
MNIIQDIKPISDFVKNVGTILDSVRQSRRPLFVTKNGVAHGVVLAPESYQELVDSGNRPTPAQTVVPANMLADANRAAPVGATFSVQREKYADHEYDHDNVFAKILRGELPANKIYENEHALGFHNIAPAADIHAIVVPRGAYSNIHDFTSRASDAEQLDFWKAVTVAAEILGVPSAYNIVSNNGAGPFWTQGVPHFHVHLLGGKKLDGGAL